jgi:hypothetical protein
VLYVMSVNVLRAVRYVKQSDDWMADKSFPGSQFTTANHNTAHRQYCMHFRPPLVLPFDEPVDAFATLGR